jgi:hypothetical protein
MHLPIAISPINRSIKRRFHDCINHIRVAGNYRIVDHLRQHYPPGHQDIQNQERQGFEHYLSHDSDDWHHSADDLFDLRPGSGVHFRKHPVNVVRGGSDDSMETVLWIEVN